MVPQFCITKIELITGLNQNLIVIYQGSNKIMAMGVAKALTVNRIEQLSTDPLSGLDCTVFKRVESSILISSSYWGGKL